jgi:hypothetical protein
MKGCIKKGGVKQFLCPYGYVNEEQNHSTATCYLLLTMHPSGIPFPSADCVKRLNKAFEHLERQLQKEM